MTSIQVDSRTFDFPDGWLVTKYDDTAYYNNQFKGKARKSHGLKKEMKALDLIALNPMDGMLYLIESKDYRTYRRQKKESPADEYIHKVIDTLTGILPTALCGKRNSSGKHIDAGEDTLHRQLHLVNQLRMVLHFEQPQKSSKLFPHAYDLSDIQSKIRCELGMIDKHALVVDANTQHKVPWMVN